MRRREADIEERIKRLEDQDKQRTACSNSELREKREQLNTALAETARREHEISLRESSMRANEIEFEARLKRLEEQERPRIDESNREYREKREQLNAVETARREREFEERIKRLEDQDRQRGSRRMEADDESVEDKEQTCESNNGLRNTKNGNETRLKEDEFEARLNAIELAKVEIERNITLGSKNNDGGTKPKEAKEDVSKVTSTVDRQFPFPKFSRFSGDEPRPKSEATYEEWKYEVNCAQESGLH